MNCLIKITSVAILSVCFWIFAIADGTEMYKISTYVEPEFVDRIKAEKNGIDMVKLMQDFDCIHNKLISKIPLEMRGYFKARSEFKIMDFATGDIFGNGAMDFVFVIFDVNEKIARIIVYNAEQKKFRAIYTTVKVIRLLDQIDCNYGIFGTLDYQLGRRIIEQLSYEHEGCMNFKGILCLCLDVGKGKTFVLDSACYGKGYNKKNVGGFKSICISTDGTYNNWECMRYNKKLDAFEIFYGQAFSD